jgi:predicted metal-dependent phosphoesterase TrpH
VLKVELHSHTSDDPVDRIPHTAVELIDRAAQLGFDALAITLHDWQLDLSVGLEAYAASRQVVLIPGIERTIEGKHVLLLNFSRATLQVSGFEDLARLKRAEPQGLVVAPHPFFPHPSCLHSRLDRHAGLFDAVECNAMHTAAIDFNHRARRWAEAHGKPMVGNGDVHRLEQLGTTFSLVDAARDASAICRAIAAGRVRVESTPLSLVTAARIMTSLMWPHAGTAPPRLSYAGRDC